MKKLISISLFIFLSGVTFANPVDTVSINRWLDKLLAVQQTEHLKSYYTDKQTADVCESWRTCSKWAFEEYAKDQSFKVTKAEIKTRRRTYRHRVAKETHLFVEATYEHRTVCLEFTTPVANGRTRPYQYIGKIPQ